MSPLDADGAGYGEGYETGHRDGVEQGRAQARDELRRADSADRHTRSSRPKENAA